MTDAKKSIKGSQIFKKGQVKLMLMFLFVALLPWQTQWIIGDVMVGGAISQYGHIAVYLFDVVLVAYLVAVGRDLTKKRILEVWSDKLSRYAIVAAGVIEVVSWLSILWAAQPLVALTYAIHITLAVLLFASILVDKKVTVSLIMVAVVIGMLVPALFGWVQAAMQVVPASVELGIAAQDPTVLGTAVIEHADGRWLRAYGTFPHPNMFGGFLAFALVGTFLMVVQRLTGHESTVGWIAVALFSGALLLSASRTAWLAAVLGVGLWYIGLKFAREKERVRRMAYPAMVAVTVVVIMGLSLQGILFQRFDTSNRLEAQSVAERQMQWGEAGDLINTPGAIIAGVGMHNYTFALEKLQPLKKVWEYQPIHNVPALILVELGLIGFIAALVLVVSTDWRVHKHWNRPTSLMAMSLGLTLLTLVLFDHYLWTQASGLYLIALFLGLNARLGMLEVKKA